ncbi:MAG: DUF5343 domain-containing protein [Bacteroidales bacterium]|nr:DUF5343 domain-containing protein [Bacteroidales bacterium]
MNYPYSTSTGTITKILEKVQSIGKPSKADIKWLSSIGITKSSEQRILLILKFIGFVEKNGTPTELWTNFRSSINGKKTLGTAIRNAYQELFEIYPNAENATKEELTDFFTTRTDAGGLAISHTVNTFKNLCKFAEFDDSFVENKSTESPLVSDNEDVTVPQQTTSVPNALTKTIQGKNGITININIQLTVPETTDEKVYDKFFESMKKHLLS